MKQAALKKRIPETKAPPAEASAPPPARPPLGLPHGSVRALLAMMIVAVVVVDGARGRAIEALWTETLMIVMAHYFTSRRLLNLPPEVMRRLEEAGHIQPESHPLYLPRYTIRAIFILTFIGLGVYLYREARLTDVNAVSILGVVFAYLLGVVAHDLLKWWTKGRQSRGLLWWEDFKAIAVLAVLAYVAAMYLLDRNNMVPAPLRRATLGMVLFYFGSR